MLIEAAAAAAGLGLYALFWETRRFQVERRTVALKGDFPRPLEVLHLSDLHFYKGRDEAIPFLQQLSRRIVDFIFLTGDLIDHDSGIEMCVEALRPFSARHGIFAVLGNHDYYHVTWEDILRKTGGLPLHAHRKRNDVDRLMRELAGLGIPVLQNRRVEIEVAGRAGPPARGGCSLPSFLFP